MADVVAAWRAAVGEAIARNAWPARLARDGTLHVNTSSSAWAFELTHLAASLRARLAERVENVPKVLRFAPGPLPEPDTSGDLAGAPGAPAEPTPEERELAAALAAPITHDELRELVARAAAASLSRRRSGRSV